MPISDKRCIELAEYLNYHSMKEAIAFFNYKQGTVERAMRNYKKIAQKAELEKLELNKDLLKIKEQFSAAEIRMMASSASQKQESKTEIIKFSGDIITFGVISDTHFGSIYFQNKWYEAALREFDKCKIDFVVHAGDICEGMSNRAGHIYELSHLGYYRQKEYANEKLSQCNHFIYGITGNHDDWFRKANGADLGKDLEKELKNYKHLGDGEGVLKINNINIMLWHGLDSSSYATCFDDETEILTEDGFIPFHQLNENIKVATMTKDNHVFEWQYPTEITDEYYKGNMYHFKSRVVDCMVTPDHGMWARANESIARLKDKLTYPTKSHMKMNYNWHRKNAKDIYDEWRKQKWQFTTKTEGYKNELNYKTVEIPRRESKNKGVKVHHFGKINIKEMAEFIAWYATEGHATKTGQITICQDIVANPENHKQILNLFDRMQIPNYRAIGMNDKNIGFGNMEMMEFLHRECGHLSRNKKLPKWLKNQNAEILQIVLDTLIKGDGWINGKSYGYKSISPQLRNDVAEIAIKLGYGVSLHKDTVCIRMLQNYPSVVKKPQKVFYDGSIYCCSVPNGLICVKRNGKVLWTHNSYRIQKIIESFYGGEKPNVLIAGHVHKQGYFFERNVHAFSAATLQKQSKWMRGKRLQAHTGFWILKVTIDENGVNSITSTFYPFYK